MDYKIIPMTAEHIADIKKVDDSCFESPWSLKAFESELENPIAFYFVAVKDDEVIGYCGYWWTFGEAQITNVAVSPEYRQKGIASALMDEMTNHCREMDVFSITLEVRVSNNAAISMYEKYGFERVGLRPKYYNNKEDALLMTKEIEKIG